MEENSIMEASMPERKIETKIEIWPEEPENKAMYSRRVLTVNERGDVVKQGGEAKVVFARGLMPNNGDVPVLPPNCRLYQQKEGRSVFVLEFPPTVRTVSWKLDTRFDIHRKRALASGLHRLTGERYEDFKQRIGIEKQQMRLAFPYVVAFFLFEDIDFRQMTLFYRVSVLESGDDDLLVPNVTNRHKGVGKMCLPSVGPIRDLEGIGKQILQIVRTYWAGEWNGDLMEDFDEYSKNVHELSSPWAWEHASTDPGFVFNVPWTPMLRTVRQEVNNLLNAQYITSFNAGLFNAEKPGQEGPFAYFLRKIREADSADGPQQPCVNAVVPSPQRTLVLRGMSLSIGDTIEATMDVTPYFQAGETKQIEWFGRDIGNGCRHIKYEGLDEPQMHVFGGSLIHGLRLASQSHESHVEFNGQRFGPGSYCHFSETATWPGIMPGYYRVTHVQRDRFGTVHARLDGQTYFTIVGEGETPLVGIQTIPSREVEEFGRLRDREFALQDETALRCGDYVFKYLERRQMDALIIRAFHMPGNGNRSHEFLDQRGTMHPFESGFRRLSSAFLRAPDPPIPSVDVGGRQVALGDTVYVDDLSYQIAMFSPLFPDGSQFVQLNEPGSSVPEVAWELFMENDVLSPRFQLDPPEYEEGEILPPSPDAQHAPDTLPAPGSPPAVVASAPAVDAPVIATPAASADEDEDGALPSDDDETTVWPV